ncbi:putative alcohol dehydrogenase-like protein [Hyaloraphidium curvatum]|nr:putative alcohol dehydrogenase-like protein [Hyaloraphidium curvatum]
MSAPKTTLQLRSLIDADGTLSLLLRESPLAAPGPDEVVVRVEAAPINPSDLGLLLAGADVSTGKLEGSGASAVAKFRVPEGALRQAKARVGKALPVGNEGAGTVIATGDSPQAKALLGKVVGTFGGAMYSTYRVLKVDQCLPVASGVKPADAAAMFVNPLTALGMVGTMKLEGHKALVHTAAASNLGQMLVKLCNADNVPLVNIVRRPEQAEILRKVGAKHVCDSSSPTFREDLTKALIDTGATIAFDAIGGGKQAGTILACMEAAANASAKEYSRYGSSTHKQVYIYGGLDRSPTEINRTFGMAWSIGGWLLMPYLDKVGKKEADRLRKRVADEITTTFASSYTAEVSLPGALALDKIMEYAKQATGQKFLIRPNL